MTVMVFPDSRKCLTDLIEGTAHLGDVARVEWNIQAGDFGEMQGPFPIVHIYLTPGGTEGYVDRNDRVGVEVYTAKKNALDVLESVRASIIGNGVETAHGYLDTIATVNAPAPSSFRSDTIDRASMTVDVISRPI